jgi:hypothetical protein
MVTPLTLHDFSEKYRTLKFYILPYLLPVMVMDACKFNIIKNSFIVGSSWKLNPA